MNTSQASLGIYNIGLPPHHYIASYLYCSLMCPDPLFVHGHYHVPCRGELILQEIMPFAK